MSKLIDSEKLCEYLKQMKIENPDRVGGALYAVLEEIDSGAFDPTPQDSQPGITPEEVQEMVRLAHKIVELTEKPYKREVIKDE